MKADELVTAYLRALATSDVELALSLFAVDGQVHSPLYGLLPAAQFYPALFADTRESLLTLRSVMHGVDRAGSATVSFWFHFDWRLPSGVAAPFDVVDVAQLDPACRITALHIIYDTVDVRPLFEAETGSSWRVATESDA